jgi:hypothetical protein
MAMASLSREQLTRELILKTEDDELSDIIGNIAVQEVTKDTEHEREALEKMGPGFLVVGSAYMFEGHWACEGFDCYFGNTEGRMSEIVIRSYRALGLNEAADIIEKAFSVWQKECALRANNSSESLTADYQWYDKELANSGVTDVSKKKMAEFVRKNTDLFVTS